MDGASVLTSEVEKNKRARERKRERERERERESWQSSSAPLSRPGRARRLLFQPARRLADACDSLPIAVESATQTLSEPGWPFLPSAALERERSWCMCVCNDDNGAYNGLELELVLSVQL